MTTRRDILKGGAGLAAILASGKAPAYLVKSMVAARQGIGRTIGGGDVPPTPKPYWGLCFTAEEAGATVGINQNSRAPALSLLYSTDATTWNDFVAGQTVVTLPNIGDKVYLKAGVGGNVRTASSSSASRTNNFVLTKAIAASGDVTSLLDGDNSVDDLSGRNYCFARLFDGCSSLTAVPEMPSQSLSTRCYMYMFNGCASIKSVVIPRPINGDTLVPYSVMFLNCTSLTSCKILTQFNTIGVQYASSMFQGCSKLSDIEIHAQVFSSGFTSWVEGVAATGTFRCPTALGTNETIQRGVDFCPVGWTVVNFD